jgi:hypothetical protein
MKTVDENVTKRARSMYAEHQFGDFSYGRESRERSDYHLIKYVQGIAPTENLYDIGCGIGFWMDTYNLFFQHITKLTMGSFLDRKSCKTIFMDQVITPRANLFGKGDLSKLAASHGLDIDEFGYSRPYIMLSAIMRKKQRVG